MHLVEALRKPYRRCKSGSRLYSGNHYAALSVIQKGPKFSTEQEHNVSV